MANLVEHLHQDAIFLEPRLALETARCANRVQMTEAVTGLQVCYYLSQEPLLESLPNLVHVSPTSMLEFFATTHLRLPTLIVMPTSFSTGLQQRLGSDILACLKAASERRESYYHYNVAAIRSRPPPPRQAGRLRVMGWGSRSTMVMQHATRGVLEALARLGHETLFLIEPSDVEAMSGYQVSKSLLTFQPHLVISVNYLNNQALHPATANVVWWQDRMPALKESEPCLPWRDNDLVYSLDPERFRPLLTAKGLPPERQRGQHGCIDTTVFRPEGGPPRQERTMVFVGTSYRAHQSYDPSHPSQARFLATLDERLRAGEVLTSPEIDLLGQEHGIADRVLRGALWNVLIRDEPVRWMCGLAEQGWNIEIYGPGWDRDPIVRPFHRGMIAPGPDLASLYRRASHALSATPNLLSHQRLAEIAACGCSPVVYDCRRASAPPHWGDGELPMALI